LNATQFRTALTKYGLTANNFDKGANVDALNEITQNDLTQNYSLGLSGGNDAGKFRASFLYSKNAGFLKKSQLNKYLGNFTGAYKFLDNKLSLDFGLIAGSISEDLTSVSNNAGSTGNLLTSALSWNPTVALKDATGKYKPEQQRYRQSFGIKRCLQRPDKFVCFLG